VLLQRTDDELGDAFTLELETGMDELDIPTEDERGIEELEAPPTLELEITSDELDVPTDELEDLTTEEELPPSTSVPLFPLSPPHAVKIRAMATIPNNVTRCFIFFLAWDRPY